MPKPAIERKIPDLKKQRKELLDASVSTARMNSCSIVFKIDVDSRKRLSTSESDRVLEGGKEVEIV